MPIIKKKMSTSAYVLIAILIIAAISLPILHVVGVIDLSFIGEGFLNIMTWASADALNGLILVSGVFVGGMLCFWTVKTYILGTQVPPTTVGNYVPTGQTISNNQQQEETVVTE